ncbi:F-box only protein 28-like isoform X2 [Lytechinus variegatus]|uniref:F-box only protein 28-like isoform X2 n=1 Tax=Lytechinus variegatus TaxID=7654 RepID=UPI001BB1B56C|nr:F-box only protein 28-like isoform X2 [Lytechinus variegatus]
MAENTPSSSSSSCNDEFQVTLQTVPDVVLSHVLSYLSYEQISQVRSLCARFNLIGQQVLNQGFSKLDRFHSQCAKELKAQLPRRESERRMHPLARHCDILSAVETRLSLLAMTYTKYIDLQLCCFIPGKVIDEAFKVLHLVKFTKVPPPTHELLQELRDLSSMAMEHFDEKIVPDLKKKSGVEVRPSNLVNHTLSTLSGRSLKVSSSLSVPSGSREQFGKLHSQYKATLASFNTHRRELQSCKAELQEMRKISDEQNKKMTQQQQLTTELSSRLASQNLRVTEQEKRIAEQDKRLAALEQKLEALPKPSQRTVAGVATKRKADDISGGGDGAGTPCTKKDKV